MVDLKEIAENLIQGKADKVKELTQRSVDEGQDIQKILN
ncbi:MAG TPA: cobalamin-binding protein, partial [Candidatus Aerophobetes bacterium]|nr:cobalamin-binding protein [Candidatus Aerophobetes bacterium]